MTRCWRSFGMARSMPRSGSTSNTLFTLDEVYAAFDAAWARTLVKPLIRVCG